MTVYHRALSTCLQRTLFATRPPVPLAFRNAATRAHRVCDPSFFSPFPSPSIRHPPLQTRAYIAMAPSIADLAQKVDGLSLDALADKYPACHPEINPLDLYRAHLANVLEPVTGVDPKLIYTNLQWTSSLDKGDLALPTASLRIKDAKYDQLAKEWAEKV